MTVFKRLRDMLVQSSHFWTVAIAPPLGQSVWYWLLISVNLESASTASGWGCVSQTWRNNNNNTNIIINNKTNNYNRLPSHFVLGTLIKTWKMTSTLMGWNAYLKQPDWLNNHSCLYDHLQGWKVASYIYSRSCNLVVLLCTCNFLSGF